ncbi:MAG: glutamine amidotransferase [Clostridiales bacterium]|jgi:CobQ-like glutamine amidotransferase family enzyme|nr:glutamine amidotransferase [Clostridiales bacterium]
MKIAHLYPELLNLYGDRGNILAMTKRLEWRGIDAEVVRVLDGDNVLFSDFDIVFLGGGSDREQEIVAQNLSRLRDSLSEYVEQNGVVLAICGGYQLLGEYYQMGDEQIEGLGILKVTTERGERRMIGNAAIKADFLDRPIVGFENHGGATRLNGHTPLGKVIFGHGNNGTDGAEGVRYKNVFGTYLHGPLLPKNPHFCDYILECANAELTPLDDAVELRANDYVQARYKPQK